MSYLTEFDGKHFVDVARGDPGPGQVGFGREDKKAQERNHKTKKAWLSA
jgi:molecular chaperone HtpG